MIDRYPTLTGQSEHFVCRRTKLKFATRKGIVIRQAFFPPSPPPFLVRFKMATANVGNAKRYVCEINRNIAGEARFFLYEIKQVKTQKNAC